MLDRGTYGLRFDGLEAMVVALGFIGGVTTLLALGVPLQPRLMGLAGVGLGLAALWLLRRFRATTVAPARDDVALVAPRSLASLLLLGIGWFVLAIAALFSLVAASMLSDPKFRDPSILLLPAVPLLVGGALVYAGLRIGRPPAALARRA